MNSDLLQMKKLWEELNFESYFSSIHHFASDKFASPPSSLNAFYDWCKGREIRDENQQTVARAIHAANLNKSGTFISLAIVQAWEKYPLVTR